MMWQGGGGGGGALRFLPRAIQHLKLTFPEFHFETEAKVDFPSACI